MGLHPIGNGAKTNTTMTTSFQIPLHFEDLIRRAAGTWRVTAPKERSTTVEGLLETASDDFEAILSGSAPPNTEFSALYNAVSRYSKCTQAQRKSIVNTVVGLSTRANVTVALQAKIAAFFLAGVASTAEVLPSVCKFWDKSGRGMVLDAIYALATQIPSPSPYLAADTDQFANLLQRVALGTLDSATAVKDKTARRSLARILGVALHLDRGQFLSASTALIHALNRHEHIAIPIADAVHTLIEDCDMLPFCVDLVREMAKQDADSLARDTVASKSCSTCIMSIAERHHEVIKANLAALLSHLDGPSYMIRNGIVHALGVLIRENPRADDPLLDVLKERAMRDVNAFTRSKTLQTWAMLAEAKVIPHKVFPIISAVAAARLDDKGAIVRKAASQLLSTLLRTNPFAPVLKMSHFQAKLDEEQKIVTEKEDLDAEMAVAEGVVMEGDDAETDAGSKEDGTDGKESEEDGSVHDDKDSNPKDGGAAVENADTDSVTNPDAGEPDDGEETNPVKESENAMKLKYYMSAVAFITSVETGLAKVYGLLRSKSITDVAEAVSLLVTAIQFQLDAASGRAVRAMLPLALAREPNVRAAAVRAYVTLLAPGDAELDEKESAVAVTNGLVALTIGATAGELACLEALVSALSKDGKPLITKGVITVTWDLFAGKIPDTTMPQRKAACILIGMFTTTFPDSLQSRVQTIESVGLSEPAFRRWSCAALCKLPEGSDETLRISKQLIELCKTTTDLAVVDQAISAVYRLHPSPEVDISNLIKALAGTISESAKSASIADLSRFLVIVGQVAIKQLVRNESMVGELKKKVADGNKHGGDNEDTERSLAEADNALDLAEAELVGPESLLGRYGAVASRIAADEDAPGQLRAAAVLCMTKLMCVKNSYCSSNLRLMFTILKSASHSHVRSNAVIALGDLAFRFPNLVEPWSSHIYAALRDEDTQVRTNSLMALTHLILNDMVKVKGQIVEIAVCLLDDVTHIADKARNFFHELARKSSNAIYNILPDIISCLSKKSDVTSVDFKTVIAFLIGLLDKDKHAEGMIEKLCHRFRAVSDQQECRDLAHCISLLNISERGLKKFNDNFKSYANAIVDDAVHKSILSMVAKAKKNCTSANAIQVIEELCDKIDNQRKTEEENSKAVDTSHEEVHSEDSNSNTSEGGADSSSATSET